MAGTDSELRDLNSAPAPEQQQDRQSSSSSVQNSKDSVWMNMEEFLSSMFLANGEDQGTSSNDQPGQTKNPASPKAFENITLENFLARAGIVTDDVQEPPPQQTRYEKGIKERRRLRMVKNRELAAQFRANKQAYKNQLEEELYYQSYTRHLEEELYLRREENKHLKLLMKYELGRASESKGGDATQSQ